MLQNFAGDVETKSERNLSFLTAGLEHEEQKPICFLIQAGGLAVALSVASLSARAEDNTFTQIGTFLCAPDKNYSRNVDGQSPPFDCGRINFPQPFGDKPTVIANGCIDTYTPFPYPYNPGAAINAFNSPLHCQPIIFKAQDIDANGFHYSMPDLANDTKSGMPNPTEVRHYGFGTVYFGNWVAVGSTVFHGIVTPKYLVLSVVYAPPGTMGDKSSSSITYTAGESKGTLLSASSTFKEGNTVTVGANAKGVLDVGDASGSLSIDFSNSTTDSQSLEIKNVVSNDLTVPGPAIDGVNHDLDEIWVLLNPRLGLEISRSAASWNLESDQGPAYLLYAGWLKTENTAMHMPDDVQKYLSNAGITVNDYSDILSWDPLAVGGSPKSPRFVLAKTFVYEPAPTSTVAGPPQGWEIGETETETSSEASEWSKKVSASLEGDSNFKDIASFSLKDVQTWEWTRKSTQGNTSSLTYTAKVSLHAPSSKYLGPTLMNVLRDTLFNTYAFQPVDSRAAQVALTGNVADQNGKPAAGLEVKYAEGTRIYKTVTSPTGKFVFVGSMQGPGQLTVGATTIPIGQRSPSRSVPIRLRMH